MSNRFHYLSLDEAARELGVPRDEVRRRGQRGEPQGVRLGPLHWLWVLPRSEVERVRAVRRGPR